MKSAVDTVYRLLWQREFMYASTAFSIVTLDFCLVGGRISAGGAVFSG
jgi:hypothetical protein